MSIRIARTAGRELAFDGDPGTRWATDAGLKQGWLAVDLGGPRTIDRACLSEAYDRIEQFELQAERDGRWETFARGGKIGSGLELKFPPVAVQKSPPECPPGDGRPDDLGIPAVRAE